MLGNCEKMVVISSTTNEWPQTQIDEKGMNMGSTGNRVMEKPEQPLQQQQALKCPRCDSSNTKFCYYNNYSLSQPRHFCKACKRYWTRGGTLRNVPVGGGCRKNKRVKRVSTNSVATTTTTESSAHTNIINPHHQNPQSHIEISSSNSTLINPLFYGLPSNNHHHHHHHHPFHGFSSRGASSDVDAVSGFDLQPQLSALGLGFSTSTSSGILSSENGFNSNSLLSSYSMFGSSSSPSTTATPTMASLIASSFQQQKFMNGGLKETRGNHFQNLMPFEDMNIGVANGENGISVKEVKMEGGQNRMEWNVHNYNQNQIDQIGSHDQSSLYWNPSSTTLTSWPDLPNIGSSSVTSLI